MTERKRIGGVKQEDVFFLWHRNSVSMVWFILKLAITVVLSTENLHKVGPVIISSRIGEEIGRPHCILEDLLAINNC